MLKNMKMGTKIGGLALLLIIISCIVAYIGYNGMVKVTDRVIKADDVNRIVKFTHEMRRHEKNFIIRRDKIYVSKVHEILSKIIKQANETKAVFNDPVNKQQMDQIISAAGSFKKEFKEYVNLFDQKNIAGKKMVKGERALSEESKKLFEQTSSALAQFNKKAKIDQADNLWLADAANSCIKIALESQISQNMYIRTNEKKFADEIRAYKKDFFDITQEGIKRLETSEEKKTVLDLGKQAEVYVDKCEEYVKLIENNADEFELAAKEKEVAAEAAELIAQANKIRVRLKKCFNNLLAEADKSRGEYKQLQNTATDCLKYILLARAAEKNFIIQGDKKYVDEVNGYGVKFSDKINKAKKYLKTGKDRKAVALMGDHGKKYFAEFNDFVAVNDNQLISVQAMVKAARALIETAGKARADQKAKMDARINFSNRTLLTGTIIAIVMGILLTLIITKSITRPLMKSVDFVKTVADGDLTGQIDINQTDEIGVLCNAMNMMAKNLQNMFKEITQGTQTLTSSVAELSSVSEQITTNSEQTAEKSNSVAAAAEEMATNMNSMAAATEQFTANIQMIVSASEEMTATINEIAGNTAKGSETTSQAVTKAQEVSGKMNELGKASAQISKVTETIADISEQTNLLALNATIEAARAGEAGKGFAVVAGEIKALAHQTAEATSDISEKISWVQTTTAESVTAIDSSVKVINDINDIVTTVATAIEEQSATTQEISNNVSQIATGVQEVNENVNQTSAVAGEMTRDISEVSQAADEMSSGSQQVNISAAELSRLAENLNEMVGKFKI